MRAVLFGLFSVFLLLVGVMIGSSYEPEHQNLDKSDLIEVEAVGVEEMEIETMPLVQEPDQEFAYTNLEKQTHVQSKTESLAYTVERMGLMFYDVIIQFGAAVADLFFTS